MITLVVRRLIEATPARVFEAWTDPVQLREWWGPPGVRCTDASVELRVGGCYRIGNRLPDGQTLWISGQFEVIEPPHRLTYSWQVEGTGAPVERVTVEFEARGTATEVVVTHQRIGD